MNQKYIPISNFAILGDESLRSLACELSLSMSFEDLLTCRHYFLAVAKRLPCIAELELLDALIKETRSSMEYTTLTELYTDEDFLAQTYADMMERRRLLSPDAVLPPSYGELTTLGRKHLDGTYVNAEQELAAASGKAGRRKITAKKKAKGYEDDEIAVGGANTSASICREPITSGDAIYAVLRNTNNTEYFDETLDRFLASGAVINWAKEILILDKKTPLFSLMSLNQSVNLNSYFPYPAEELRTPDEGAILIANAPNATELLLLANELGLRVRRLGHITNDKFFRLTFTGTTETTFTIDFLKALLYTPPISVQIERGAPEDTLLQISPANTFSIGRDTYSITKVAANGSSPFHASLYAAIGGMSAAVAAGADPNTFTITASVSAPQNKYNYPALGASLAAIIGLYRAEAEFSLYNSSVSFEESADAKTVTVWTMAPTSKTVPDTAIGGGTMLFYLEPAYKDGGMPDFESFRKLHTYLYELHKDGIILSARAASGDLLKTLGKMSLGTEIEYVRSERINAKLGGIVVETKMPIDGLLIARTEAKEPLTNLDN